MDETQIFGVKDVCTMFIFLDWIVFTRTIGFYNAIFPAARLRALTAVSIACTRHIVRQKAAGTKKRGLEVPKALAEEILPESVMEQAAQDGENLCFTDPVSNAIVADALLEQELVTDPQAAARLDAIRQLDDVTYDTAFEPPVSDYELDGLDLER